MSASPFEHPFLSGLLGDEEVADLFSAEAELDCMISFEEALAAAEAREGIVPAESGALIASKLEQIQLDMEALNRATRRDGVVVPELVRQLRKGIGEPHGQWVHFGATSQDAIDTSLALRLKRLAKILDKRIDALISDLDRLDTRYGKVSVMAHTRMQAAIPVSASRKILSWRDPLARHRKRIDAAVEEAALLQFGGAAGTLDKLGKESVAVSRHMAAQLGLEAPARARHNERDGIAAFASALAALTGSLGKIGQDIALMVQSEVGEAKLASGGGSSAMPHKSNPVGAEALVTLARFNATLVAGMHQALVHENERSGAAWTLEWMLLPQIAVAAGAALNIASELISGLEILRRES